MGTPAIARELMERNGGTLACETSRKGTIFCLELAALPPSVLRKAR
jgi:signal transduction histidine kinase